jgi:hypothetical protein
MRDAVILTERPLRVCRDGRHRLHADDGPAILYPDGWGVYAWHGVRVPERVIMHPLDLGATEIRDERNVEVRRVMLERYGPARYLLDVNAQLLHRDETGELYCATLGGDEPLVMVKVRNGTAEPDGSFKDYFLRVPPTMRRAREAVAWTFTVSEHEYQPVTES